ncbi:hypothetical protein SAMN05216436_11829 [bacterium A37T11]|nr:hypothetical protein SAMN05216436_11829 [bacterium A37T11]
MKIYLSYLLFITLAISSCNFSAGIKKDLKTGLSFHYKGFRTNNVFLVDSANQKLNSNKIPFNAKIGFLVYGISKFSLKNGKIFPGMSVAVEDQNGFPVVNQSPDLFANSPGFSEQEGSVLLGSIRIIPPMKAGQTYHLKTHVWDKNNASNILDAEANIIVK